MVIVLNILGFAVFLVEFVFFSPHIKVFNLCSDTLHCYGINTALLLLLLFLWLARY